MMTARRTCAIYTVLKIYISELLSQLSSSAASSGTSSASALTGSTASKSSKKAVIVPDGFIENLNTQPIQNKK